MSFVRDDLEMFRHAFMKSKWSKVLMKEKIQEYDMVLIFAFVYTVT